MVNVVIPTLRGLSWLPACLESLHKQTFRDFDITVIDNASTDGTRDFLAGCADVNVIHNAMNNGFAEACNQGIRTGHAAFVALLNDDTEVSPVWLERLVAGMQDGIGACASLMIFANQPLVVQSAGIAMDRAAIAWDRLGGHSVDMAQIACEIFGASGGAALYRRAMLDEIGLFDTRFFAYLEDVDLAWRAQCAGWRCCYVPQAVVQHKTSATSGAGSAFKNELLGRNKMWLAAKNARWQDLPMIAAYDIMGILWAGITRGEWSHLRGRIKGLSKVPQFRNSLRKQHKCIKSHIPIDSVVPPWKVVARQQGKA